MQSFMEWASLPDVDLADLPEVASDLKVIAGRAGDAGLEDSESACMIAVHELLNVNGEREDIISTDSELAQREAFEAHNKALTSSMIGDALGTMLEVKFNLREDHLHEESATLEALRVAAFDGGIGILGDVVPQLRVFAGLLERSGSHGVESKEISLMAGLLEKVMTASRHVSLHVNALDNARVALVAVCKGLRAKGFLTDANEITALRGKLYVPDVDLEGNAAKLTSFIAKLQHEGRIPAHASLIITPDQP